MWGTRRFVALLKIKTKALVALRPVVFVPPTLWRMWGTRPIPCGSVGPRLGPDSVVDEVVGYVALGGVDVVGSVAGETADDG